MALKLQSPRDNPAASSPPQQPRLSLQIALGITAIVLLTFLAYLPAIRGGFIWDDDAMVIRNPLLWQPDGLRHIWFSSEHPDYVPATLTSFWLEWRLWEAWPTGYHITNVLLHSINSLLLWRLLRVLRVRGAWVAALLFAVHP